MSSRGLPGGSKRNLFLLLSSLALLAPVPLMAHGHSLGAPVERPLNARLMTSPNGPKMRILVHSAPAVTLRAPLGRELEVRDGYGRVLARLRNQERLRLEVERARLVVVGAGEQRTHLAGSHPELWVLSSSSASGGPDEGVWLYPRRYRGAMRLLPSGGMVEVINHIRLETYLPSVVGAEMPAGWPLATLQAQAVAARTYALRHRGRKGSYDLKATFASQVYKGVESETDATRRATRSTRGLVLAYRGKLIDAVFHSSSGGRTAYSGQVWSIQLPYLVSVPDDDSHSPAHRWRKPLDEATLARAFSEIGGAHDIRITATSPSGRVRQAQVIGPGGQLRLSGKELRRRLGLRSTLVTFEPLKLPTAPDPSLGMPRWRAGIQPMAASRSTSPFSGESLTAPPPPGLQPPGRQTFESPAPQRAGGLMAIGRGFGHGVGMSQWGAHGLALRGEGYRAILRHYYRGVSIVSHASLASGRLARLSPLPAPASLP